MERREEKNLQPYVQLQPKYFYDDEYNRRVHFRFIFEHRLICVRLLILRHRLFFSYSRWPVIKNT